MGQIPNLFYLLTSLHYIIHSYVHIFCLLLLTMFTNHIFLYFLSLLNAANYTDKQETEIMKNQNLNRLNRELIRENVAKEML